jgi:hypothetical protein
MDSTGPMGLTGLTGLQEGSVDECKGCDSPQRGEGDSAGESEAWDGLQREQDEPVGESMGDPIGDPMGGPTGMGDPTGGPTGSPIEELTDQFCSSYNQKKPLIDFGQFLTYNACRQRNAKVNRVRKAKQKATIPPRPKATKEQLEYIIQAWGDISKYKLLKNFSTRPLTIEDYLNKSSPP